MKNHFWNIFVAMLLLAAPAAAQDFRSTSTLTGSGSSYSSPVAPVGSVQPMPVQSSAGSAPVGISSQRRVVDDDISGDFDKPEDPNVSDQYPLGDGWILLAFAALCAGGVWFRQRKSATAE